MTETFVGEHGDVARERMRELKTLGVGLAIDDFGTGYSSLAILHDMPFDILKVDRAFINEVDDEPAGARSRRPSSGWAQRSGCAWSPRAWSASSSASR